MLLAPSLVSCINGSEAVSSFCRFTPEYLKNAKRKLEDISLTEGEIYPVDLSLLALIWPLASDDIGSDAKLLNGAVFGLTEIVRRAASVSYVTPLTNTPQGY